MNIVEDYLKTVKANKYTYYNLNKEAVKEYRNLYNYLKEHKHCAVNSILFDSRLNKIKEQFKTDYLIKYKTMELISYSIIEY